MNRGTGLKYQVSEMLAMEGSAERRLLQTVVECHLEVWRVADETVRTIRNSAPFRTTKAPETKRRTRRVLDYTEVGAD